MARKNGKRVSRTALRGLDAVTKKDFTAIADILCQHDARASMVGDVADYFKTQNPRFNRDRFVEAVRTCKRK